MLDDIALEIVNQDVSKLKRLGLDEIALVKGQKNYCAVLVNLDTGKLIAILPKRTQETLRTVLLKWGIDILNQIEEVSIDLWEPYKNLIQELMPSAEVVGDLSVMKQVNQELDKERRKEKKELDIIKDEAEKKLKKRVLSKSKYSLLKNEENLTEEQKEKLAVVKEHFPSLKKKHDLKEEFRKIYEKSKNWKQGMFKIINWLKKAVKFFPESCKTIRRWFGEIISYFDKRTTNGMVEGVNNKLKLIKRRGYGFKNFNNFLVRSMLCWHFVC